MAGRSYQKLEKDKIGHISMITAVVIAAAFYLSGFAFVIKKATTKDAIGNFIIYGFVLAIGIGVFLYPLIQSASYLLNGLYTKRKITRHYLITTSNADTGTLFVYGLDSTIFDFYDKAFPEFSASDVKPGDTLWVSFDKGMLGLDHNPRREKE